MARLAAPSGQAPTRHRAAPNARGLTATGAGRAASIVRPHRHLTPKSYTVSAMAPRHLINENGKPFEDGELDALSKELNALDPAERRNFRDANARAVARHSAIRMLIVAGPGTGKSTLFKERILFWLEQDASAKVLALSFVRKLVADLAADVQNDTTLTAEQKRQADIFNDRQPVAVRSVHTITKTKSRGRRNPLFCSGLVEELDVPISFLIQIKIQVSELGNNACCQFSNGGNDARATQHTYLPELDQGEN
jgi:UvrD/REP helicase N-terminal domain